VSEERVCIEIKPRNAGVDSTMAVAGFGVVSVPGSIPGGLNPVF